MTKQTLKQDLYELLKLVKGNRKVMILGDGSELDRIENALDGLDKKSGNVCEHVFCSLCAYKSLAGYDFMETEKDVDDAEG